MTFRYPERLITVCPKCATEAVLRDAVQPGTVLRNGDRIAWHDWELRRDQEYFFDRTLIEYPAADDRRPQTLVRELSSRGYIWLTAIPIATSALVLSLFPWAIHANRVAIIAGILAVSAITLWLIRHRDRSKDGDEGDLVESFWELAAPDYHERAFQARQMELVRDVSYFELDRDLPVFRLGELVRQAKLCEDAVAAMQEPRTALRMGRPMVPVLVRIWKAAELSAAALAVRIAEMLSSVAMGQMPVAVADEAILLFPKAAQDKELRVRLRVLACQKWFEAGWSPRAMHLMGKLFPNVGQAIASENEAGLWNLYTLWKRGKVADWKTLGQAETVFELAADGSDRSAILMKEPDLLMVIERSAELAGKSPHSLIICEEGLFFDGGKIESAKAAAGAGRVEVKRLQAWMEYYFETFQHYVAHYRHQEKAAYHDMLWKQALRTCPTCGTAYLGVPGEAGIAVGDVA